VISTPTAPAAVGPYSQAIQVGNTIYVAGQIGIVPATGELIEGGIEAQTRQALENIRAILRAAGFGLEHVVQAQVFLADLNHFAEYNRVYAEFFPSNPPARATVQAARIPRDALVEIMVTAVR
jgi:2-iminobutanoate/2-iminopropanoate deaminase